VNAYRNRLSFYQRFCAHKRITDLRLGDYDHLLEFVGWLRKETKQNGEEISDRYVFNIFATLGTFALSLDITVPAKKILPKLLGSRGWRVELRPPEAGRFFVMR